MLFLKSSYVLYLDGKTSSREQVEAVGYQLSLLKCSEGGGVNPTAGTSSDPGKKVMTSFKVTSILLPVTWHQQSVNMGLRTEAAAYFDIPPGNLRKTER